MLLAVVTVPGFLGAQDTYRLSSDLPMADESGQALPLAWAGGLNSAQFSTLDIDGDGDADLIVFDRTTNSLTTYRSHQGSYEPAPEYALLFPPNLRGWVLLRDFNCDGKNDLFTSDPFGVRVFVNTTVSSHALSWREYHPGFPLLTQGFSGSINLKINETDIPAIDDIDGDGDLDIVNARFVGAGTLEYHQNMSKERTGTCDSMQFVRVTQAWGGVEDCNCNVFAFGGAPCPSGGRSEHAGGKALTTLDADGDGDRDLLFSQENCSRVHLLTNSGDALNAVFTSAVMYPPSQPINFLIFPAVYLEDLDFDGTRDLVASPNVYSTGSFNVNFAASSRLYRNTGSSSAPVFGLLQNDFLQDQSVDVGENCVPAFADADNDADLDLVLGNAGTFDSPARLFFFRNTGTPTSPSFQLEQDDYLGLSLAALTDLKPQFVDMNRDGRTDLALAAFDPRTGRTSLYYAPNQSDFGLEFGGQTIVNTQFELSRDESPHVVDVNRDGFMDILLAKASGALQYWENSGDANNFVMTLKDPSYLGYTSGVLSSNMSLFAADLTRDGNEELLMGQSNGSIALFPDFRNADDSTVPMDEIVFNPFTESYGSFNLGGRIWPAAVNLYREDKLSLVVGNALGGLRLLRAEEASALPADPEIVIYPNPPGDDGLINARSDEPARVQIFTSLGQGIGQAIFLPAYTEGTFNVSGLAPGLYIVRFEISGKSYGRKLAITR